VDFELETAFRKYVDPGKAETTWKGLEYKVFHWLLDAAVGNSNLSAESERALEHVGFIDAVRNSRVSFGIAA
jgi:hypothetical protein